MIWSLFGKYLKSLVLHMNFCAVSAWVWAWCEFVLGLEICYQLGRHDLYYAMITSLSLISQIHGKYLRSHSLHFPMEEWAVAHSHDIMAIGLFPAQLTSASCSVLSWAHSRFLDLCPSSFCPPLVPTKVFLPSWVQRAASEVLTMYTKAWGWEDGIWTDLDYSMFQVLLIRHGLC